MTHYVCTGGCGGESDEPGVCEAEFCKKEGQLLTPCECTDGSHANAGEKKSEEDSDSE